MSFISKLNKAAHRIAKRLMKFQGVMIWFMTVFLAFVFIKNGVRKFDPEGFWGPAFENWGFPIWFLYFIGILETLGGLLVIIPKVRFFGALIISAVMIGALITRLIHGLGWDDGMYIFFVAITCLYIASLTEIEGVS